MPTYDVEGQQLYYEDIGSGQPVVLIHGAAGSGKGFLDSFVPYFKDSYRILIPDLRGMGQSARVHGDMPASAWITDTLKMMDAAGVERSHLIGVSLGSRVVARIAVDAPERCSSIVVDAPIIANEPAGNAALNAGYADIAEDSDAGRRHRRNHGEDWREVVASYFHVRNQQDVQDYLNLRPFVAKMKTPTFITRGDTDDPVHPLAHCFEWHQLLPSSWMWIVPETGASGISKADQFKPLFAEFVKFAESQPKAS